MSSLEAPIGIFDSGVGGLTVAKEVMTQIPDERLVYFGDTARLPYGSKSKDTIIRYSRQITRFLHTQKVKAIVVACNTASSLALPTLEEEEDIPVIGVIRSGVKTAVEATRNKRIGVIGTDATIGSHIYSRYIKEIDADIKVMEKACPLFVPLVEEGLLKDPVTDEIAQRYLAELMDSGIDTLILGCTHYPLIRKTIGRIVGEGVTLVNPAYETARALLALLDEKGLKSREKPALGTERYSFFVSDGADKFIQIANSILGYGILSARTINIEEY